jgi:hypothetical protein
MVASWSRDFLPDVAGATASDQAAYDAGLGRRD